MGEFWRRLFFILGRKWIIFWACLIPYSILIGAIETVGLGAIMPFVAVATNPSLIQTNPHFKRVFDFFGFADAADFVIALGFVLLGFYIFRALTQMINIFIGFAFAQRVSEEITTKMFARSLRRSYQEHTQSNTATIVKRVTKDADAVGEMLRHMNMIINEFFIFIMLYAMILFVQWKITLVLTVFLAIKVLIVLKSISRKIRSLGNAASKLQEKRQHILQSSLHNFKIVKLLGNSAEITENFRLQSREITVSGVKTNVLANTPRVFVETVGFCILIALVIYIMWKYRDAAAIVPIVSMFVLVLYRLLPSAQHMLYAFNTIQKNLINVENCYNELSYEIPEEGDAPIAFEKAIETRDLNFHFRADKPVIKNANFTIKKGEKIGFCGESGGGKSTLIDLLSGVYKPVSGGVYADGVEITIENVRAWRRKIGLIPQDIYLFDGSVAENITFGKHYDEEKIVRALKQANIYDFLTTHDGINTRVGEGGILLSGGQKQRVGIARALYGDPSIMVLDEATSALDSKTEAAIMDEIYDFADDKTLLIVAHRLSTLARCDRVFKIERAKIAEVEVPKS
ncbi:MAG: ABC transporter ATP-binding protein/permease [Helicobacteraceae bacterium]|jgi:ATP-binding cassette subfamily B protein/ATP-binding cassette subfamily C protein|nr:ABC transporter ATP-binding protein/permease [Helicobacteraceae bacterium]